VRAVGEEPTVQFARGVEANLGDRQRALLFLQPGQRLMHFGGTLVQIDAAPQRIGINVPAVVLVGDVMLALWLQRRQAAPATAGAGAAAAGMANEAAMPAEQHFPIPLVVGHGLIAATTLVLVLLAALDVVTAQPGPNPDEMQGLVRPSSPLVAQSEYRRRSAAPHACPAYR